ncbi:hypothetical protein M5K25_001434 [Dendrobium thyrsiflorum]|uniref:DUF4283 domain-containing protein n=1 Tax=Dendrobium thyrsiflorum TaxID=117978 RepID=A0ABD0VQY3_DENTH
MDPSTSFADFPPLSNPNPPPTTSPPSHPLVWDRIFSDPSPTCEFPISTLVTPEETIRFPKAAIAAASEEWNLTLVGYSMGKRPFYVTLLNTVRRSWKLKGTLKLISLNEGFFLFNFSTKEDFDMIWNKGAWFILGKPFVFQKWNPHFTPKREEFTSVPIWFKIMDLPLCCWTPTGISMIATKIGTPLSVDSLTASKSRLTFARVCVQVDSSAQYPDTIPIDVDGKIFKLQIQYEWKPSRCSLCQSINHEAPECPSNQTQKLPPVAQSHRGRSTSRKHRSQSRYQKGILPSPKPPVISTNRGSHTPSDTNPDLLVTATRSTNPEEGSHPVTISQTVPSLLHQPSMPGSTSLRQEPNQIPNLNSPNATNDSSNISPNFQNNIQHTANSPNKFTLLQDLPENSADVSQESSNKEHSSPSSPCYDQESGKPPTQLSKQTHNASSSPIAYISTRTVWHKKKSLRFSIYTWLALIGGLKTADVLIKRNIAVPQLGCAMCHGSLETATHLFFECDYAFKVLNRVIPGLHNFLLRPNICQVLSHIDSYKVDRKFKCTLLLALNATVYHLWLERNNRKFKHACLSATSLATKILKVLQLKIGSWINGDSLWEHYNTLAAYGS